MEDISALELNAKKTLEITHSAISNKTGIIHELKELPVALDDPRLFHFAARSARTQNIPVQRNHFGTGLTSQIAQAAAIGETIERYCLSLIEPRHLIFGSHSDLIARGFRATDPSHFALFSDKQYSKPSCKFKRFTGDSMINWIEGYSLIKRRPVLVPACLVYVPYPHSGNEIGSIFRDDEDHVAHSVSTGTACARSRNEAILRGIYEIVERDAIMIVWLNQITGPLMKLPSSKRINKIFNERFFDTGLKFYVLDITLDIPIPTMLSVLIDDVNDGLAVSVGAATDLDTESAAVKALVESAQGRIALKSQRLSEGKEYSKDFNNIISFMDHILLYSRLKSIPYLNFLIMNEKLRDFDRTAQKPLITNPLSHSLGILSAKNMDVIFVDLTTPDIRDLGLHVVKVLIPGMLDVNAEHEYRLLGGRRIYKVPHDLGYSNNTNEENLNNIPHPFP